MDLQQALGVVSQQLNTDLYAGGSSNDLADKLLLLALRARGFNNFRDFDESGEKFFVTRVLRALDVKVGDKVIFGQYAGSNTIEVDGEELIIMGESEIYAVVE